MAGILTFSCFNARSSVQARFRFSKPLFSVRSYSTEVYERMPLMLGDCVSGANSNCTICLFSSPFTSVTVTVSVWSKVAVSGTGT